MKYRSLGAMGGNISEVGLGCWQLGADWGNGVSKEEAFAILQAAVEAGVTFFDTADVYGDGRSESLIGEFFSNRDAEVRVATKYGRKDGVYPDGYTEQSMRKAIENSIVRLKVEALDLVQLHCIPTEELKKGDVFIWLRKLKDEGLIKNFGASVETIDEGFICLDEEGLCSLQVICNIFRQKLLTELLPMAKAKGVGVIVRLPLASGLLSGKFSEESIFSESDHRNYNKDGECFNVGETFAGLPFLKGLELTQMLREYVPHDISMATFAQRWLLDNDAVSTIIPGASSITQVKENVAVSGIEPLSKSLHMRLFDFYNDEVHAYIRGAC